MQPSVEDVWRWLEDVPDPEIPVVSVVDLGIVRNVEWNVDKLIVSVTPTYSGCPATAVISFVIEETLRRHGVKEICVRSQLSPAWTTAWITETAREKLRQYGIAPPIDGASCAGALAPLCSISCPRCGSTNTQEVSRFGSTPCKAAWRCNDCWEPFDYFKSF